MDRYILANRCDAVRCNRRVPHSFTTYLCLQVCPSKAVMVLVEIHHLESIELIRDFFDLLLFTRLNHFYTLGVPPDVLVGHDDDDNK